MGRPLAPCGKLSAYRRHLRNGEPTCPACRKANREAQAAKKTPPKPMSDPFPATLADAIAQVHEESRAGTDEPVSRSPKDDLEWARDRLVDAIRSTVNEDPTRLGPLTRELRETWKALAELGGSEEAAGDEFTRARAARAARKARA